MGRMGRILLLRHGQSTWNAERRWQGWADPPLSEHGREQARGAAAALTGKGLEVVASSDLARARETADIIAAAIGAAEVIVEEGLRERNVGEWSGLTDVEIHARWPGMLDAWRAGELAVLPGGEGDINVRVVAGLDRLWDLSAGRAVVAVTHGGVIRGLERHLGIAPQSVGNVGGRWIEGGPGAWRAGDPVVLAATGSAPTTIL